MNRYNCLIVLPEGTKDLTILADSVHPDSTCATRFHKKFDRVDEFGRTVVSYDLVGQYPTERLIIESVEYNIENGL